MLIVFYILTGALFSWLACRIILIWQENAFLKHPIYSLAPKSHQQKKVSSFGGLAFLLIPFVLIWEIQNALFLWLCLVFLVFGSLGFLDDYLSIKNKKNQGLTTKQKLFLQIIMSTLLMLVYHTFLNPINITYASLSVLALVATTNATNLTDGIDGLLGSLSIISFTVLIIFVQSIWPHLTTLEPFFLAMIGALISFLYFNWFPSRLFMGDTGSMALGGLIAGACILGGNPWILICIGAPYVLETFSVIFQVLIYKLCKKRMFLMSPFHHHLELMGYKEPHVVFIFILFYICILVYYFLNI